MIITSRQLDRAPGRAKQASLEGPVYITERGEVKFVLLSAENYDRLVRKRMSLADLVAEHATLPPQLR